MLTVLEKIEHQPKFPNEDLSDRNAELLCLALANMALTSMSHKAAEKLYPILKGTHQPLLVASGNLYDSSSHLSAIDFGIKSLEAITWYVAADHEELNMPALQQNIIGIVDSRNTRGVSSYFEESYYEFTQQMGRTAGVIAESAERFHRGEEIFAILGGAIARQFELHCTGTAE